MIIAVDFDGTCVTHEFPRIGKDIGAAPVLRDLVTARHQLMLWTMRSGPELEDAVCWMRDNVTSFAWVNANPTQTVWTTSPKAYAHIYIDDAALGCPLVTSLDARPHVDWKRVRAMLVDQGVLPA